MSIKSILTVGAATLAIASSAFANPKIGVINSQRLFNESAPAKAAVARLKNQFKAREDQIEGQIRAFRADVQKFQKEAAAMSEEERAKNNQALAKREAEIGRLNRELIAEKNKKFAEEQKNFLAKASKVIDELAKRQKFDLILERGNIIMVTPSLDLTDQVLRQLNTAR